MQLVTLALIVGSLWVLLGQGQLAMRALPWPVDFTMVCAGWGRQC